MKEILNYYGFTTIEEASEQYGFYNRVDAEKFLTELYEEDILWD